MTERRKYLLLVGVIAAAVVGALLLAVPGSPLHKKPTLGLDLQGGLEVVLRAVPDKGQHITPQGMQTAQSIVQNRANGTGVAAPNIAVQGGNEIVVQLAGVHDPAKAAAIIGKTGQLQFFDFEHDLATPTVSSTGQPAPLTSLYSLLKQVEPQAKKGNPQAYYLIKTISKTKQVKSKVKGKTVTKPVTTTTHKTLQGPAPNRKQLLLPYSGKQPPHTTVFPVPAHRLVVHSPGGKLWYLFKYFPTTPSGEKVPPELTGNDLVESGIQATVDTTSGQPVVDLQFTRHGTKQFQKITKNEYLQGQLAAGTAGQSGNHNPQVVQQYAKHNAIVLDGVLQSTPYIDYTDGNLSDGIGGGQAQITMGAGGLGQANDLALILKSGSLPYSFQQIERTDVSATLGKSSLHQALWAAAIGLAVVALFLLILYRFLGLVAVAGLVIYAALYYAAILLFNVTLTLPGFAGLILTIGVAADANVVVFERIKEESRSGKSMRAAIANGYAKGFRTILDANVVTAITALILFLIAVADVKGFALMLLIGTAISLLTAVAATRAMLGLLSGFKWFSNPRFMGAEGQQTAKWLQIDFMGKRKLWFAISGAVVLATCQHTS